MIENENSRYTPMTNGNGFVLGTEPGFFLPQFFDCIGIGMDFKYDAFGEKLQRGDKQSQYLRVINDLGDRIFGYERIDTRERAQEFTNMAEDYMKLNAFYNVAFKNNYKGITEKDIRACEDEGKAEILAKAYTNVENGKRKYIFSMLKSVAAVAACVFGLIGAVTNGAASALTAAGVGVAVFGSIAFALKLCTEGKRLEEEKVAKKMVSAEPSRKIKEHKMKIKEAKSELKNLKAKQKNEMTQEYENSINELENDITHRKEIIKELRKEIKERIEFLPDYRKYEHKAVLGLYPSDFMVNESNKRYQEKYKPETPCASLPMSTREEISETSTDSYLSEISRVTSRSSTPADSLFSGMSRMTSRSATPASESKSERTNGGIGK